MVWCLRKLSYSKHEAAETSVLMEIQRLIMLGPIFQANSSEAPQAARLMEQLNLTSCPGGWRT